MGDATAAPFERPGGPRRFAAGAWHVLAGFGFLMRRPALWPLAILPALIAVVCLAGGLLLAVYSVGWLERYFPASHGRLSVMGFLITITMYVGTLAAGLVLGLAVALLLSAPALEALSSRVDAMVRGGAVDHSKGWRWEMAQAFRGTLYFLIAAPGVFLLSLIPVVGPALAVLWGSYALAFQQTDAALSRRGLGFGERRKWHRYWKLESMGFGFAGLITLVVPFANFLVGPALAVGGTLLVLELEDQLIPPDVAAS
ncbi:MAG: EI24 domain-containing protein [Byssovorax sp.]